MHEDVDFLTRLYATAETYFIDSQKNYVYRRRANSLCTSTKKDNLDIVRGDLVIANNIIEFCKKKNLRGIEAKDVRRIIYWGITSAEKRMKELL